jgi:hypothetical protein
MFCWIDGILPERTSINLGLSFGNRYCELTRVPSILTSVNRGQRKRVFAGQAQFSVPHVLAVDCVLLAF